MLPPKTILKLFGLVVLYCALLFAPWPGLERAYRSYFCLLGDVAFERFLFWRHGTVEFVDPRQVKPDELPAAVLPRMPKPEGVMDVVMALENRKVRDVIAVSFKRTSSGRVGYVPTAMFLAWVLATPVSWRRRLIGLGWGMVLIHLFLYVRVSLTLLQEFGNPAKPVSLFAFSPFMARMCNSLESVLHDDPTVSYVVPTFLWVLLLFRPSLWQSRAEAARGGGDGPNRAGGESVRGA